MEVNIQYKIWQPVIVCLLLIVFYSNQLVAQEDNYQLKTPYPIIFVHGLVGDGDAWYSDYDIIDFLTEPAGETPLKFGGAINVSLDYNRAFGLSENTYLKDVKRLTEKEDIDDGDLYIVNFDVLSDGTNPEGISCWGSGPLLPSDTKIIVDNPDIFRVGDLLRIENQFLVTLDIEFLRVISISGNVLTVERGLNNSSAQLNPSIQYRIYNISNLSNQAAVAKQGYGIKKVIELVKEKTKAQKVILVGHSMGGLACREYIRSHYMDDVAKLVTIGTPHEGSNLTESPELLQDLVLQIDKRSDALRDLRTGTENWMKSDLGIYIFGGNENDVNDKYYSKDINADGDDNDYIKGIRYDYTNFAAMAKTYIASDFVPATRYVDKNDGVVLTRSQYLSSSDTIMCHRPHISTGPFGLGETKDIFSLIRGLDEPDEKGLAYEIGEKSTNKGFITFQKDMRATDVDLFKLVIEKDSKLKIILQGNSSTGIKSMEFLDDNMEVIKQDKGINATIDEILNGEIDPITDLTGTGVGLIEAVLDAGTYYIRLNGVATGITYKFPYSLQTEFEETPLAKMSVSQSNLQFYDGVTGVTKNKTVTLTNNGTAAFQVTNISFSGTNAAEFSATPVSPFTLQPGTDESQTLTISFNPTSVGPKVANLQIETNSPDIPIKTVTLNGNGTDHETKELNINYPISYNYGDTKINTGKTKTFTILNTGSNVCTINNIILEGDNPELFTITSITNVPFEIESGETKQVSIKFQPLSIGTKSAILKISNNSDNISPEHSVELIGNGTSNYYSGLNNYLTSIEYWFDDDYTLNHSKEIVYQNELILNIAISSDSLNPGLHKINFRVKDSNGYYSSVVSEMFHKFPVRDSAHLQLVSYEYWFDNDYEQRQTENIAPSHTFSLNQINATGIETGLHTLHIRYKDSGGQWSSVVSEVFHKFPIRDDEQLKLTSYEYWFDSNYEQKQIENTAPSQTFSLNQINATGIETGLHTLHIRYKDSGGQWSSIVSEVFHKFPVRDDEQLKLTSYEYWFDNNYEQRQTENIAPSQTFSLNQINATGIETGLHTLHIRYKDSGCQWSSVVSEFFHKVNESDNSVNLIKGVRYCFNEDSGNMNYIDFDSASNPFEYDDNLNVKNLNAGLNTIQLQFLDSRGYWSSVISDTFLVDNQFMFNLTLDAGWNLLSVPVNVIDIDIKDFFQKLIDDKSLIKVQDELGNSLENWGIFGGWKNNIGDILLTEGYKAKLTRIDSLLVKGTPASYPYAIPLQLGWNIIGYPQTESYDASAVMQQLIDRKTLIKVQDELGSSLENWGIFGGWKNNIGSLKPGEGYKVKVIAKDTLWIYESYLKSTVIEPEYLATTHFRPAFTGNGVDHMNINVVELPVNAMQAGDELAVFDRETCVGAVTVMQHHLQNQSVAIAASAADNQGMPGFVDGDKFILKLWNSTKYEEHQLEPEIIEGAPVFTKYETTVASLEKYMTTGFEEIEDAEVTTLSCYPNPFRDEVTIEIKLKKETEVQVEVLNQLGQRVKYVTTQQKLPAGIHKLSWNGRNASNQEVSPGVYHLKVNIDEKVIHKKLVYSK